MTTKCTAHHTWICAYHSKPYISTTTSNINRFCYLVLWITQWCPQALFSTKPFVSHEPMWVFCWFFFFGGGGGGGGEVVLSSCLVAYQFQQSRLNALIKTYDLNLSKWNGDKLNFHDMKMLMFSANKHHGNTHVPLSREWYKTYYYQNHPKSIKRMLIYTITTPSIKATTTVCHFLLFSGCVL